MSAEFESTSKRTVSAPGAPLLLSAEQVALLLSVHRATVFDLIRRQEIVSVKIGRRRLISRRAVERFIAEREGTAAT
jgi:excisionase family DNA binding protein